MKRIALVSSNIAEGLPYQRLHIPFRGLRHEYDIKCFDLDELRHSDAFYFDAVIVCHAWHPSVMAFIEKAKMWYGIKVIVDIDDLMHDLPSDHPDYSNVTTQQRVAHILQAADHVTVSTEYLKGSYGHLNKNISVIENCIDKRIKDAYRPAVKPYKNAFVAGWTGGQSHRSDQFEMIEGMRTFLQKFPDTRAYFHLLCPQILLSEFGAQIHFEPSPTYYLDYPGVAAAYPFDVCCVPLIDHPFNHAKSDLRLLDMAVNDILIIASPRASFLEHQDKGIMLYADDKDKNYKTWAEQLEWAYKNPDKVKEITDRAKEYVYSQRHNDIGTQKWRDILASVL